MEALTPCLFLLPTLVACALARYVGSNVTAVMLCLLLNGQLYAANGDYVENWRDTGLSGIEAEVVFEEGNRSALIDADANVTVYDFGTEWPWGTFDDITSYYGIEENGRWHMWRDQGFPAGGPVVPPTGFTMESVGDYFATATDDIGTTLGAAVLLVVGVYGSFVAVRHGLRWLRGATAALLLVAMLSPALLQAQSPPTTEELLADVVTELQTANGKLADLRAESDDVKFLLSVAAVGVGAVWGSQLWACVVTGKNQRNVW